MTPEMPEAVSPPQADHLGETASTTTPHGQIITQKQYDGKFCSPDADLYDFCIGNIILLQPGKKVPLEKAWTTAPSTINGDARGYLALGYNLGYRIPANVLIIDVDPRKRV